MVLKKGLRQSGRGGRTFLPSVWRVIGGQVRCLRLHEESSP